MVPRIDRALLLNALQEVPYYSRNWRALPQEILFFDPQGIDWGSGTITGLQLRRGVWRRGEFAFPRTVYNRCFPEPRGVLAKLSEAVGAENIFNFRTQLDKWEVHCLLNTSEVAPFLPETHLFARDELPSLLEKHQSLVFKPRRGHGGAGVFRLTLAGPEVVLITTQTMTFPVWGEPFYLAMVAMAAPQGVYLVQEYIPSQEKGGVKFDVRLLLQKDRAGQWQVTGQLSRVTAAENLLTNGYRAVVAPEELVVGAVLNELHRVGRLAAEVLDAGLGGLGELGVDFLLDAKGHPWILEVNGKPDKGLFWKLGDGQMLERVYLTPLEYQEYLLGKGKVP